MTTFEGLIALHVGLRAEQIDLFMSDDFMPVADVDGYRPQKYLSSDERPSWEQWEEPAWEAEDSTDDAPGPEVGRHVMIYCASISSALENYGWMLHEGFQPVLMQFKNQRRTIGVVTKADEWSEAFININAGWAWVEADPIDDEEAGQ